MEACFHVEGVQCNNCRTGLSINPQFDPMINRWISSPMVHMRLPPEQEELSRLEGMLEELRAEVRALTEELKQYRDAT